MAAPRTVKLKNIFQDGSVSEREEVHKKAFTKWLNAHLSKAYPPVKITHLIKDLSDGNSWLSLFEVLLNRKFERSTGHSHLHTLANLQVMLDVCKEHKIKLDGINAQDISEGNQKTILGLLWNIIVHFQLKGALQANSQSYSIEKTLQTWCQQRFKEYKDVKVTDFSKSWRDGKAFNAVIHSYRPDLFDFEQVMKMDAYSRLDHAFTMASLEFNVPRLLEPIDVDMEKPDKKMITMYLTCLFERMEHGDKSREMATSSTPSTTTTRQTFVTTNTDESMVAIKSFGTSSKAFFLSRKRCSDKADNISDTEAADFPHVFIEERKTIHLGSMSSERTSSSSSTEPVSPLSKESHGGEEVIDVAATTTEVEVLPALELSDQRVTHQQKYTFSSISDEDIHMELSPETKRRFMLDDTSSSMTTDSGSSSAVVHVETIEDGSTTRRVVREYAQGTDADTTTVTTIETDEDIMELSPETKRRFMLDDTSSSMTTDSGSSSAVEHVETSEDGSTTRRVVREYTQGTDADTTTVTTIETDEDIMELSPETKRRFMLDNTSSSMTTDSGSSSAVVHVETGEDGSTTRRVVREYTQGTDADTTTVTTTKESRPGETVTTVTREFYTVEMPSGHTRTITRTIGGTSREVTSDTSHVFLEMGGTSGEDTSDTSRVFLEMGGTSHEATSDTSRVFSEMGGTSREVTSDTSRVFLEMGGTSGEATSDTSRVFSEMGGTSREVTSDTSRVFSELGEFSQDGSGTFTETTKVYKTTTSKSISSSEESSELDTLSEECDTAFQQSEVSLLDESVTKRDELFEGNLHEVEIAVVDLERRAKDSHPVTVDLEILIEGCTNLDLKIKSVVTRGRKMVAEKELDEGKEKNYIARMEELEDRIKSLVKTTKDKHERAKYANDQDKILVDKLNDAAIAVSNVEPLVKSRDSSTDIKTIIRERDQVEVEVIQVLKLGRGMVSEQLFDEDKNQRHTDRMNQLERRIKLLRLWPIRDLRSVSNHEKLLDDKLKVVEATHSHLEPHIKYCFTLTDVEHLIQERDDFVLNSTIVIHIGRSLIHGKVIDQDKAKLFTRRINKLEKKTKKLTMLPIRELNRVNNYEKYLADKLTEVESEVNNIEPRIKNSSTTRDIEGLLKDRNALKDKVDGILSLGRRFIEHGSIDKIYGRRLVQRMDALEKRSNLLWVLPIKDPNSTEEYNSQFLEEMFEETEDDFSDIKDLMETSIIIKDNTTLIKQRNETKQRFNTLVILLQEMISNHHLDKDKSERYVTMMKTLEKRMKMIMIWPLTELRSVTNHNKYLNDKLNEHERAVKNFEPHLKSSVRISTDNTSLIKERDDLDTKIQSTVNVGRAMISQGLVDKAKSGEYTQRLDELQKKVKALIMWPIVGRERLFNKEEFLVEKLNLLETEVLDFELRIKQQGLSATEIEELCKEREDLELKANGVLGFGQCLYEDPLFRRMASKGYRPRMDSLAKRARLIMLWPIGETQRASNRNKFLKDKLLDVENKVSRLYAKIRQSINNRDNKDLIKERDDVNRDAQDVIALGRGMVGEELFDKDKAIGHHKRMDALEKRMTLIMGWPILHQTSALFGSREREKFLVDNLHEAERGISKIEQQVKQKNLRSEDAEALIKEREDVERKVLGVVGLGHGMIEDKLVDKKKVDEYTQRLGDIERKIKYVMEWPIIINARHEDYNKYYENKLVATETRLMELVERYKTTDKKNEQVINKQRDDFEVTVYAVTSLGRGMIQDKFFEAKKEKEYDERISNLERTIELLMKQAGEKKESPHEKENNLKELLEEADESIRDFELRSKKEDLTNGTLKKMSEERDRLVSKVNNIIILGHDVVDGKLVDGKKVDEYATKIDDLKNRIDLLKAWPYKEIALSTCNSQNDFDDKISDAEIAISNMEPRVKQAIHNKDNKELIKERAQLYRDIYNLIRLGRDISEDKGFHKDKHKDYQRRMHNLERRMRMLMGWPILEYTSLLMGLPIIQQASTRFSVHDRVRFLDHKLQEAEKDVASLEPRVKTKNLSQNTIEVLTKERNDFEPEVLGVIGLGLEMIKDNLVDMHREKEYLQRFKDLQNKMKTLMLWPIIITADNQDYNKYFEDKLIEAETSVCELEPRIKEPIKIDAQQKTLMEERDDIEIKVYAVTSLGRGMIEGKFFEEEKAKEYDHRISNLERAIKLLMIRPVGLLGSNQDHEKYFEDKLTEVETAIGDLKPRIIKTIDSESQQTALIKERDEVEMKVYVVTSLGRGMIEDKFFDQKKEKEYIQRIANLERTMKLLMMRPIGDQDGRYDHKKTFEEKLFDAETNIALLERRVKKSIHNKDNKDLIKERDDLNLIIYDAIRLGRGMAKAQLFDNDKVTDYQKRMDDLERRMRLLMGWPILPHTSLLMGIFEQASTSLSVHDRVRFLDHKLQEAEKDVEDLEPRVRVRNLTKDKVEALTDERDNLESKVLGVIGLGCHMIRDNLVSKNREKELLLRFDRLEIKMKELMLWPIIIKSRDAEYKKYFEGKMAEVEIYVSELEPRIKKSTKADAKDLLKERDDIDTKVYAVTILGRGMIEDKFFDENTAEKYNGRIIDLERAMKLLMLRPIGTSDSDTDYYKYFEDKLTDIETSVGDLEPRIKKAIEADTQKTGLIKERIELELKVYAVTSLGRGLIEDQLFDERKGVEYGHRISNLEHTMKLLMMLPIGNKDSTHDHKKEFDEKLLEAEIAVSGIESRVKKAIHNKDNKDLIHDREDLDLSVHNVMRLGRGMVEAKLFDKEKDRDYQKRMENLERRIRFLMGWPILEHTSLLMGLPIIQQASTRLSVHDRVRFLDHKLQEAEKDVENLQQQVRQKNLTQDEVEVLTKGRKDLEPRVYGVIGLGVEMIRDNLVDMNREKEYLQRFENIEKKMKELMLWPIIVPESEEDYDKYFEEKITQVESAVADLKQRIKKPIMTDTQQTALIKERDNVETDVYVVTSLGRGMIDDRFFDYDKDKEHSHRIIHLEHALKLLLLWPIGKLHSVYDREKFLEENLHEAEEAVSNFEQRAKKKDVDDTIKEMARERDELVSKVEDVISLGRDMVNDQLEDSKNTDTYTARMDGLDIKVGLLKSWPHADRESIVSVCTMLPFKHFDEQLTEMEMAVTRVEPRVTNAIHNKDNKDLIEERDDLDHTIQDVLRLGRGMVEAQLFNKDKVMDYQKRMNTLERRMRLLMGWPILDYISRLIGIPILEQTGELLHFDDREKFLDEKLHEAEVDVHELEPRIKKRDLISADREALTRERDNLEPIVVGVVGLGRKMIEDNLVDKKKEDGYRQRINDLEARMKLLMCWSFNDANELNDAFFEERLRQEEVELLTLEDGAKKEDLDESQIKNFIKERSDLENSVYRVTSLGRGMLEDGSFSDAKEQEYIDRMDDVETRMRMLFDWPDGTQKQRPIPQIFRDYDIHLRKLEIQVSQFEQRAKVTDRDSFDLQSAKTILDNIKALICERDQLEIDVYEVITEGRVLLQEEELEIVDMAFYTRRMSRLEERIRLLREWLQSEMIRLFNLYIILIKQHLERLHDWLVRAELKMELEDDIGPNRDAVVKQLEEHMEFHKEVGMYSTVNMILEIDMDDPGIDEGFHQDVQTLSERWASVWNWSEERKNRLLSVIAEWEKFREEEQNLYRWLVGKDEAIQMSDMIDISDEDQVDASMAILKTLIKEIKEREGQMLEFRETGEQLISDARYHEKAAKPIRDEVNDFEECWRVELDRAQRRKIQLQEAREKFLQMADLKRDVNEWLVESETLIDSAEEERDEEEEEKFQNNIEMQCEEREFNQRRLEKINALNKELCPSIEKDSYKEINYVVDLLNRRMQDASDKLEMYRDDVPLMSRDDCCLVGYWRRGAWEPVHEHEILLKE